MHARQGLSSLLRKELSTWQLLRARFLLACESFAVAKQLAGGSGRSSLLTLLLQLFNGNATLAYTLMVNQTALHGLPGAINSMNSALLRAITGNIAGAIITTSHPLPTLPDEVSVKVSQLSGQALRVARHVLDPCQAPLLPQNWASACCTMFLMWLQHWIHSEHSEQHCG